MAPAPVLIECISLQFLGLRHISCSTKQRSKPRLQEASKHQRLIRSRLPGPCAGEHRGQQSRVWLPASESRLYVFRNGSSLPHKKTLISGPYKKKATPPTITGKIFQKKDTEGILVA